MTPADLGSLKVDDVTKEAVVRTGKWVLHATSLLATISTTKESISFQTDVLMQIFNSVAPGANVQQTRRTDRSGYRRAGCGCPLERTLAPVRWRQGGRRPPEHPDRRLGPWQDPGGTSAAPAAHKDSAAATTKVKAGHATASTK